MEILHAIAIVIAVVLLVLFFSVWFVLSMLRHEPQISEYENVAAIAGKMKDDAINDDVCGFCHNTGIIAGVKTNIACSCTAALKRSYANDFSDSIDIHC